MSYLKSIRFGLLVSIFIIILFPDLPLNAETKDAPTADLLILHGRIYTADPSTPWVEAIAVRDGKIQALGRDSDMEKYRGPKTEVIDIGGRMAMPGIIDSHAHFFLGDEELLGVNLDNLNSADEVKKQIGAHATRHPKESWVRGAGWAYGIFPSTGLPTKELLDEVVPDRPSVMESCDRHSYWVNSRALAMARITRDTPDPQEDGVVIGHIVRDPTTGEPTGVLKEAAMVFIREVMPKPSREDKLNFIRAGLAIANRYGVTTVVSASGNIQDMEVYDTLRSRGELTVRMKVALGEIAGRKHNIKPETLAAFEEARSRFHDEWVSSGLIKFFADGVVETHTAALIKPYADDPDARGSTNYTRDEISKIVTELDRIGFQIMTHAIGDGAVRMTLDAYESAEKKNGPRDRRFRIEHIELLDPADTGRFTGLGVIASMQPYHLAAGDDSKTWRTSVGQERWKDGFVWRDLASSQARLVFGSDWPVATFNPFFAIQVAVTRQTLEGEPKDGWFSSQRLTLDQVLAGYTRHAAYAAFLDDRIGILEQGKFADMIVLSQDLFSIPAQDIGKTKVLLTIVQGKIVWREAV